MHILHVKGREENGGPLADAEVSRPGEQTRRHHHAHEGPETYQYNHM